MYYPRINVLGGKPTLHVLDGETIVVRWYDPRSDQVIEEKIITPTPKATREARQKPKESE